MIILNEMDHDRRTIFLCSWNNLRLKWEWRLHSASHWRSKCECFQATAPIGYSYETSRTAIPFRVSRAASFFLTTTERSEKCTLLRQKVCQVDTRTNAPPVIELSIKNVSRALNERIVKWIARSIRPLANFRSWETYLVIALLWKRIY